MGAIATGDGKVLLIERRWPPFAGRWSVPGGLIELGETARDAARREAREETGIELEILGLAAVVDRVQTGARGRIRYHYVIVDFLARAPGGGCPPPRAGGDAARARWVAWPALAAYRLTPGLKPVLDRVRRRDLPEKLR